jgi:glyoxylase-like metal-dependent hydrolase (beta-lactamase superfamily II)
LGVARIILTNRNHSRASNTLRERTGARTAIHPDDAAHARDQGATLDDTLAVGQTIGPLVVVEAAGKSPGEVAFHWPERRLLIVGDAVIGNPPGRCGLLREQVMDNPQRLRQSVRRFLDLDFDTLLVGDGEPILEGAKARLEELVADFPA